MPDQPSHQGGQRPSPGGQQQPVSAATHTAPKKRGWLAFLSRVVEQTGDVSAFKIARPLARWVAKYVPDPLRDRAIIWQIILPIASVLASAINPSQETAARIMADLEVAFFEELQRAVAEGPSAEWHEDADTVAEVVRASGKARHVDPYVRILSAALKLSEGERNRFLDWYLDLSLGARRRERFGELAQRVSDADLPNYLQQEPTRLFQLIERMPKPIWERVQDEPELQRKINAFMHQYPQYTERLFWNAVNNRLAGLHELRNLMDESDDYIIRRLKLMTIEEAVQDIARKVRRSAAWRAINRNAERWADSLQATTDAISQHRQRRVAGWEEERARLNQRGWLRRFLGL